jgi:hypothetical protein
VRSKQLSDDTHKTGIALIKIAYCAGDALAIAENINAKNIVTLAKAIFFELAELEAELNSVPVLAIKSECQNRAPGHAD